MAGTGRTSPEECSLRRSFFCFSAKEVLITRQANVTAAASPHHPPS